MRVHTRTGTYTHMQKHFVSLQRKHHLPYQPDLCLLGKPAAILYFVTYLTIDFVTRFGTVEMSHPHLNGWAYGSVPIRSLVTAVLSSLPGQKPCDLSVCNTFSSRIAVSLFQTICFLILITCEIRETFLPL